MRPLRNKNRALHIGHSASRSRNASLLVSVVTPQNLKARVPTPPVLLELAEMRLIARAFIKERRINVTGAPEGF